MDTFHSAGERHGVLFPPPASFRGCQGKNGADSFTTGKQAVSHGLMDGGRFGAGRGQKTAQGLIHRFGLLAGVYFKVECSTRRHGEFLTIKLSKGKMRFLCCV